MHTRYVIHRATIPAREALGERLTTNNSGQSYILTGEASPALVVSIRQAWGLACGLRMPDEPPYPGETSDKPTPTRLRTPEEDARLSRALATMPRRPDSEDADWLSQGMMPQ